MPYKDKDGYTDSTDTMKELEAIRRKDIERVRRKIQVGDRIFLKVMIPDRFGIEKPVMRRLEVIGKYSHVIELWAPISQRKRYTDYIDLVILERMNGRQQGKPDERWNLYAG